MNKFFNIAIAAMLATGVISCDNTRRDPGRAYMPDMAYSRAVETYASTDNLKNRGVYYTALPVAGTIARGDLMPYTIKNDSAGYVQSAAVINPLAKGAIDMKNAERLYLVNCGICHGPKLDGNGPLWKNGNGPFPAAPKNFMDNDMKKMAEGTMFHSTTFGKGQMGSYASQLNVRQRWEVIAYIRSKQFPAGTADTSQKAAADTAAVAKAN
jgi:mono/diheme cytochrome c family protein